MSRLFRTLSLTAALACLAGCTSTGQIIDDAVAHPARPGLDRQNDEGRQPGATLRFFGIKPGMKVLDVFGGGGYYTELVSRIVGPEGRVTMYNNTPWDRFVSEPMKPRFANDRLPNVDYQVGDAADLPQDTYDAAIFILGMHDLYYADPDNGWTAIDRPAFLAAIHASLKPGGTLGIIDHNGASGSGDSVAQSLHRIDPERLILDLTAAGFILDATSDHLANRDDDHTKTVFDPSLRWKSDRSVLRFTRAQ